MPRHVWGPSGVRDFVVVGDPIISEVLQNADGTPSGARRTVVREQFDFEIMRVAFSVGHRQLVMRGRRRRCEHRALALISSAWPSRTRPSSAPGNWGRSLTLRPQASVAGSGRTISASRAAEPAIAQVARPGEAVPAYRTLAASTLRGALSRREIVDWDANGRSKFFASLALVPSARMLV